VFRELVRAGCDAKLDWCEVGEQLIGSYGRAATMLPGCVLLGVLSAGHQQLTLNPPDHLLLQLGDRLVALTRQGKVLVSHGVAGPWLDAYTCAVAERALQPARAAGVWNYCQQRSLSNSGLGLTWHC
jgi:hypothetical protein